MQLPEKYGAISWELLETGMKGCAIELKQIWVYVWYNPLSGFFYQWATIILFYKDSSFQSSSSEVQ